MWNGYGVCSNMASSGEPPASQNHFNYWQYVSDLRRHLIDMRVGMEQSVIDDVIDAAANRETELRIVGRDVSLVCSVKRFKLYKMRIRVNVVLFTSALSYLPKVYLTTDVLQLLLLFVDIMRIQ